MSDGSEATDQSAAADTLRDGFARVVRHQQAGRWQDAEQLLNQLASRTGESAAIQHHRAAGLIGQGQVEAGLDKMRHILDTAPDDPVILCELGAQLARFGKFDEARQHLETAAEVAPNFARARSNLGAIQLLAKEHELAIENLRAATELSPGLLDAHTNLGLAYIGVQRLGLAVDSLFKALVIDPNSVAAHSALANALHRRDRHDAAEHHARRAIELAPEAREPHLHLGYILSDRGQFEAAATSLLFAATDPVFFLNALTRLIFMRKQSAGSAEHALLEQALLRVEGQSPRSQANIYFCAGKSADDLGDPAQAFAYYQRANAIEHERRTSDLDLFLAQSERIREVFTPALLGRFDTAGIVSCAPVFICGVPRSGTTLTEQMLSQHSQIQAGGEMQAAFFALGRSGRLRSVMEGELAVEEIEADDFKRLGEDYAQALYHDGLRSAYVTDKLPINYRHIGFLAPALPRAKFLIMQRHPLDCLLSNYFQFFGDHQPFSNDLNDLTAAYNDFRKMADHWAQSLPGQVRQISYEALVQDPQWILEDVLEFLGLPWEPAVLDFGTSSHPVTTASLGQVREPINAGSIGKWKRYLHQIRPFAAAVRSHIPQEDRELIFGT